MIITLFRRIKNWVKAHFSHPNQQLPNLLPYTPNGNAIVSHISAFSYGNAGDTLLPVVLRDLFNQTIGVKKWYGIEVHKYVTRKDVHYINKDNFLVIGGGGLFLCDTCPNDNSGWQWNCSIDRLNQITKPIIAFAVGYNRFRGQEDFKPIFTQHLNRFVEKALFVGIRNHGSIERLKFYLKSDELKNKLVFQPCMTTLIAKLYPSMLDYSSKKDFIAFNCAFDRQKLRSNNDEYLHAIARVAKELSKITSIRYYSHMDSDLLALTYFDKYNVPYELVKLETVDQIVKCYSEPRLVIGMRGHAQMIPFGCHTPILSIVSHDKLQWFLDDINHPEWGADVSSNDFETDLYIRALSIYNHYEKVIEKIEIEQEKLWDITLSNLNHIKNQLNNL